MPNDIERTNESTKIMPKWRLMRKQRKFMKLYIKSEFNGTRTAKAMGCSDVSAPAIGSRISRNVNVQLAVDGYLHDQGMSKSRPLTELTRLAYDQDPDAKLVPLKSKAIDMISKTTGLDAPVQAFKDGQSNFASHNDDDYIEESNLPTIMPEGPTYESKTEDNQHILNDKSGRAVKNEPRLNIAKPVPTANTKVTIRDLRQMDVEFSHNAPTQRRLRYRDRVTTYIGVVPKAPMLQRQTTPPSPVRERCCGQQQSSY